MRRLAGGDAAHEAIGFHAGRERQRVTVHGGMIEDGQRPRAGDVARENAAAGHGERRHLLAFDRSRVPQDERARVPPCLEIRPGSRSLYERHSGYSTNHPMEFLQNVEWLRPSGLAQERNG